MQENSYISNSKQIIGNILFSVAMIGALSFAITYIGNQYSAVTTKNVINEYSSKRFSDFYNLPQGILDIVFVGSSHSYCTFDPENFDSKLGTESFQLGMPLQQYDATYYTMREVFNYQKPSLVVVEIYWDLLGKDVDLKQALTLFDSLNNQELEKEFVNEVFSMSQKLKYRLDIVNYQKDYFAYKTTEYKKLLKDKLGVYDVEEKQQGEEYYKSKGYVFCNYNMLPGEFGRTNQFNGFDGRNYEINQRQRHFLEKLVGLCRENGAEVVFVTAPVANVSLERIENYSLVNERVSKMAMSMGVRYIDYNMPSVRNSLFTNENFRDDAHLNDSGVKILNAHFIDWLINTNLYKNNA